MKFSIHFSKSVESGQISNTPVIQREDVVDGLEFTIQTIEGLIDLVPIDMAKSVLIGITTVLSLLQKSLKNEDGLKSLSRRCGMICSTLSQAVKGVSMDKMSPALKEALNDLKASIDDLLLRVKQALQHGKVHKFLGANLQAKHINEWSNDLTITFQTFSTRINIVGGIRLEQLYEYMKRTDVPNLIPEPPPPAPVMFYGREALCSQVKDALLQDKDVVIKGPGGIGKSSIAKTLINDADIKKCYSRRFFVTFDGMNPRTITLGSFIDRIASALGLSLFGAESRRQVISNLASSPVLLVLDNAETFEDAEDEDVATQIASCVSEIATTQGVTVVLTSRTTNNARNVLWTRVDVPPLTSEPARKYFRDIYHREISDDDVDMLLGAVDFHPLSIHILAYTAEENQWTGITLLDRWNEKQSELLQTGGRKENLGFTIALSLDSPSIKALGDHALHVLWTIAFFPQGIDENYVKRLFPSIHGISSLFDTLHRLSLVYRSGSFITVLAPIRLCLLDAYPSVGHDLLGDIRKVYYNSLKDFYEDRDIHGAAAEFIFSDHLNIEHLIEYDFAHPPDSGPPISACFHFLRGLSLHQTRATSLRSIVSSLPETSMVEQQAKARCLETLGVIYKLLKNCSVAEESFLGARKLYVALQDHNGVAYCSMQIARICTSRGYFSRALQILREIMDSSSWQHCEERFKKWISFELDYCKMNTSSEGVDELFPPPVDDDDVGRESCVWRWYARMCHGCNTPEEVGRHLEAMHLLGMSTQTRPGYGELVFRVAVAAFLQKKYDRVMELLDEALVPVKGDLPSMVYILRFKAAVSSAQGNYELSRSLLLDCIDMLGVVATPSYDSFLEVLYLQGRNELYSGDYQKAQQIFSDVIKDCEVDDVIGIRTQSTRALGELEILLGHNADSDRYFAQAEQLCKEAGIPPDLLGVCEPASIIDHGLYPGWKNFLARTTAG